MPDRVLITGASGLLGAALGRRLAERGEIVLGLRNSNPKSLPFPEAVVDLLDKSAAASVVAKFRPDIIVHAAALSRVTDCEKDPDLARRMNVDVTANLVKAAGHIGSHFILVSTDQVFDGNRGSFSESDTPSPTHVYGQTKFAAEQVVRSSNVRSLILRSNNIVGSNWGWGQSFTDGLLAQLMAGKAPESFNDQFRSPVHLRVMVNSLVHCVAQRVEGVLHVGGPERLSRYETAIELVRAYGIAEDRIRSVSMSSHPQAKTFHRDGSFDTTLFRGILPQEANFQIRVGFRLDQLEMTA